MRLNKQDKATIIRQIMDDVPQIDYHAQAQKLIQEHFRRLLPPAIKKIADDKDLSRHLEKSQMCLGSGFRYSYCAVVGNFSSADKKPIEAELDKIGDANVQQNNDRDEIKKKLEVAFAGINTRKQALEAFPEFEKYLPEEDVGLRNLPITTDVMPALVQAGWPKDQKPARKARKL